LTFRLSDFPAPSAPTKTSTDVGIPAIGTGIPNVQTGHCAKTMAILQLSLKDIGKQLDIRWLMLVDDDTLLR